MPHNPNVRTLYRQLFGPPALARRPRPTLVLDLPAPPPGTPAPDQISVTAYAGGVRLWESIAAPYYYAAARPGSHAR